MKFYHVYKSPSIDDDAIYPFFINCTYIFKIIYTKKTLMSTCKSFQKNIFNLSIKSTTFMWLMFLNIVEDICKKIKKREGLKTVAGAANRFVTCQPYWLLYIFVIVSLNIQLQIWAAHKTITTMLLNAVDTVELI